MPITTAGTAWFLVKTTNDAELNELYDVLKQLPGVRDAKVRDVGDGERTRTKITIVGTDRGKRLALEVAKIARVYEPDPNADHDHAACVASAREMGVPEAWAHTPETYLSM